MEPVTRVPDSEPRGDALRLYFAPLACSLASRIVCYEAGLDVEYVQVDTALQRVVGGADFKAVNPLGQVPVLDLGNDLRLTENTAVLQWLADHVPSAGLVPRDGFARARVQQWLGFIGTELHKAVFVPLLGKAVGAPVKDDARGKVALRLGFVERHLVDHDFLVDRFTIADAYLFTVLNWAAATAIDLAAWPATRAHHLRILERPQVARAFGDEFALWKAGQKRAA